MKLPLFLVLVVNPVVCCAAKGSDFPRRALIIGVHDYLFANPVEGEGMRGVVEKLSRGKGLRIPASQVLHLGDEAMLPRLPTRPVFESTLARFLSTSRAQDQLFILFAGHAVEVDGEAFLVPIEGDLHQPRSLVALSAVYSQLARCKAQQKVLVLDVCRTNPVRGNLRPSAKALSAELLRAIRKIPPGVQVWLSCGAEQQSLEGEELGLPGGLFLQALAEQLDRGAPRVEQKPGDSMPLPQLVEEVNEQLAAWLRPVKRSQASLLLGEVKKSGATLDLREPTPPRPQVEGVVPAEKLPRLEVVRAILRESDVPAFRKLSRGGSGYLAELPAFAAAELDKVARGETAQKARQAIDRARAYQWSLSGEMPPVDLAAAVRTIREGDGGIVLVPFVFRPAPPPGEAEQLFKKAVFEQSRGVATLLRLLEESLEELLEVAEGRDRLSRRWQAHLDYLTARTQLQIAFLYEYSSALGELRKEVPARDPRIHTGWALASQDRMKGDATGKKLAREAARRLDRIIADYPGTPWELLARRDRVTSLGLEWMPRK